MNLLKILLFFIITLSTLLSAKSQIEPLNDVDKPNGNVRYLFESVFYIRKGEVKEQAIIGSKTKRTFNTDHKITSETIYNKDGLETETISHLYDKEGNQFGFKSRGGTINGKAKVIEDKKAGKVIQTEYDSGNRVINKYNSKGEKIQNLTYKDPKNVLSKHTYLYDKNGNQTMRSNFIGKDLKLSTKFLYSYNTSNELIKMEIKNAEGIVVAIKSFIYDANGFKQEVTHFNPKTKVSDVRSYRYTNIDETRNWLQQTTFKNGKIIEIRERKIQYY